MAPDSYPPSIPDSSSSRASLDNEQSAMRSNRGRWTESRHRRSSTRYAPLDRFAPQVDRMSQLQLSIIEGSPYYEEKRAGKVVEEVHDAEEVDSPPTRKVIRTFDPVDFENLHGRLPCLASHLSQGCSDASCQGLHNGIAFTKYSMEQLRVFARTLPCPLALSCSPLVKHSCLFRHICPDLDRCRDKACGFNASEFEGKGHQPNTASEIYSETDARGTYAHIHAESSHFTPLAFRATGVSTMTSSDGDVVSSVFDPLVQVLMTMNEKNRSGDTRHVTTKVLERLQEGCPELFNTLSVPQLARVHPGGRGGWNCDRWRDVEPCAMVGVVGLRQLFSRT